MRRTWFLLLLPWSLTAQQPLTLERLLQSVERHYPLLLVALEENALAEAEIRAASGRFDHTLRSGYEGDYFGAYRNGAYQFGLERAMPTLGLSYSAAYRLGTGDFAVYDGKLKTDRAGESYLQLKLPLLRDRSFDARRAGLEKAQIGQRLAARSIEQQRLAAFQLAKIRYYDWVAAGIRLRVADRLLETARQRDDQLRQAAALGQIAAIEVLENQRAIWMRRAQLTEAERGLQQAAIQLSLFLRDPAGNPQIPEPSQLPDALPDPAPIDAARFSEDLDQALRLRPELEALRGQREQIEVDRRLAKNQWLPNLSFNLGLSNQLGRRQVARGPNELMAGLSFDLPIERRVAKGQQLAAEARLRQFARREQFLLNQVEAELRDVYSAMQAAYERLNQLAEEVKVAKELESAEWTRFQLGDGTLFLVNLREQARFEAEIRQLAALADYFRALASCEFTTARDLKRPAGP